MKTRLYEKTNVHVETEEDETNKGEYLSKRVVPHNI